LLLFDVERVEPPSPSQTSHLDIWTYSTVQYSNPRSDLEAVIGDLFPRFGNALKEDHFSGTLFEALTLANVLKSCLPDGLQIKFKQGLDGFSNHTSPSEVCDSITMFTIGAGVAASLEKDRMRQTRNQGSSIFVT
jgi:hypothetical protein